MISPSRIHLLNDKPVQQGKFVLYWMVNAQRAEWNHALEYAAQEANRLKLPLLVLFSLTEKYPEANERHYAFMLQGLQETQRTLRKRGIQMIVQSGNPPDIAIEMSQEAACLVMDRGYLRHLRHWRAQVALHVPCLAIQVETDVIVPIEVASNKEEWSAATLRPKIHSFLPEYLQPLSEVEVVYDSLDLQYESLSLDDPDTLLLSLDIDRSVGRVSNFVGGTSEAKQLLTHFIYNKLRYYAEKRNDPSLEIQSHMSPYLHFGQISPLYIALQVIESPHISGAEVYLEELVVRRELSFNFVNYCPCYDRFEGLPVWAQRTLSQHKNDPREYFYEMDELEEAATHDPYWNAAMREMVVTGKMHNYMRMYWGKKILEWTRSPEEAFQIALTLNNKYFIDGRDPNSYAGVAWCFGKHDRPWPEREIFGKVRYMNEKGLRRKFDIEAYVRKHLI